MHRKTIFARQRISRRNTVAAENRHQWIGLLIALTTLWAAGCSRSLLDAPTARQRNMPAAKSAWQPETAGTTPEPQVAPQAQAALELQQQAIAALHARRPETAIRILEQALALSPQNGTNYYYLADAWLLKGNRKQALEFNHLATIYLKEQPSWARRLDRQRRRIQNAQP